MGLSKQSRVYFILANDHDRDRKGRKQPSAVGRTGTGPPSGFVAVCGGYLGRPTIPSDKSNSRTHLPLEGRLRMS